MRELVFVVMLLLSFTVNAQEIDSIHVLTIDKKVKICKSSTNIKKTLDSLYYLDSKVNNKFILKCFTKDKIHYYKVIRKTPVLKTLKII